MYYLENFDGKHVTVKHTETRYHSNFLAANEEEASKIVADLNRPIKLAELAAYRYAVETGGITLEDMSILTVRESQAQLNNTLASLERGLVRSVRWKVASGWVELDLDAIKPIAGAVAQHVAICFETEEKVVKNLEAIEDHEAMAAFDVRQAFDDLYNPHAEAEEDV